jgi:hypothetical protein
MNVRDASVAQRLRHQLDSGMLRRESHTYHPIRLGAFKREAKLAMFAHGLQRGETVTQRRCFTGFETRLRRGL